MAIYSAVPPPPESPAGTSTSNAGPLDIEAWTVSALQSLSISPVARGTGAPLSIPLDDAATLQRQQQEQAARPGGSMRLAVRVNDDGTGEAAEPLRRRDSQRRREALLKGKEGSRQRRRWENDRLLHVPNVQPPLPADWQVHPTHPVHHVPYQLAQFWDAGVRQRAEERAAKLHRRTGGGGGGGGGGGASAKPVPPPRHANSQGRSTTLAGRVPRELHATVKRSPGVKRVVRVLEEPVRRFLADAAVDGDEKRTKKKDGKDGDEEAQRAGNRDPTDTDELDTSDEEIVFVGRNGSMRDGGVRARKAQRQTAGTGDGGGSVEKGVVFDSLGEDEGGAFKRWLAHSISDYYGLDSRSVTVGNPARRVVYVGKNEAGKARGRATRGRSEALPRPLWEMF